MTSTKIAAPRKETKPIGVTPAIPSTIISQPSHFGKAPLRITEMPVAQRKANTPSMIGRKSLSHRACSACTAIGIDVVGSFGECERDRAIDCESKPDEHQADERDQGQHLPFAAGGMQHLAQVGAKEDQENACGNPEDRRDLDGVLVVEIEVDNLVHRLVRGLGLAADQEADDPYERRTRRR